MTLRVQWLREDGDAKCMRGKRGNCEAEKIKNSYMQQRNVMTQNVELHDRVVRFESYEMTIKFKFSK